MSVVTWIGFENELFGKIQKVIEKWRTLGDMKGILSVLGIEKKYEDDIYNYLIFYWWLLV